MIETVRSVGYRFGQGAVGARDRQGCEVCPTAAGLCEPG